MIWQQNGNKNPLSHHNWNNRNKKSDAFRKITKQKELRIRSKKRVRIITKTRKPLINKALRDFFALYDPTLTKKCHKYTKNNIENQ